LECAELTASTAREATVRQSSYPAGIAMARALSGTRPFLPALWGFRGPVEAELRRIREKNPTIFASRVRLVLRERVVDAAPRGE
jgi:hypothetical protein